MTYQRNMRASKSALIGLGGVLAVALSGCGGTSITTTSLAPTSVSGPAIYGVEPTELKAGTIVETSGLGSPDLKTGYITGATNSTAVPFATIAFPNPNNPSVKTIPLGFSPGAQYINAATGGDLTPFGEAAPVGAPVIFRASISNGVDAKSLVVPINPNSVVLTSPEVSGFSQKLTFTADDSGPLANGQYTTGTFTNPFTTNGLHTLVAAVSDSEGQSSTTTFKVAVVDSATSVVVAQITDPDGNPIAGATASITGEVAGASEQTVSDAQGIVILFAKPAATPGNVITVTKGALTGTDTQVLTAGHAFTNIEATAYTVTIK